MQPHKQMVPKIDKHKPTEGTKAWQSLDLDKQTWIYSIKASKQV